MKSKDETLNLSQEELSEKLAEMQEEMANLKLQQATHQISNPMRIRIVRRNIARIRTLQTEFENGMRTLKKVEKE